MKITFLGTGAADYDFNRDYGTEGFRRFSSALIDGVLLIDPGPHVPDALRVFGKDAQKIKYVINTHKHGDHFCPETLVGLPNATLTELKMGDKVTLGEYIISACEGNHGTCGGTVHFIIEKGEKRLFYGLDGAWLLYGEVCAIKEKGVDLAVLDGTLGDVEGDYRVFEHNDLLMVRRQKKALEGHVKHFVISHMAKGTHLPHRDLADLMAKDGITVAHDGMELEI